MRANETTTGIVCASIYEKKVLQDLIDKGIEFEYEPETIRYQTKVRNGRCEQCASDSVYQERTYTPDLRFGNGVIVEIKGKLTPAKRTLMRGVKTSNPDLDLRFLFQRDNWLTTQHKRRYSDFARAIGCESAVGETIPSEWYA